MTHTADDFRSSRFATHPDGRIAMRSCTDLWKANVPGEHYNSWFGTSGDMARDGWSPLDETRARVVTDEMVRKARAEYEDATGEIIAAWVIRDALTAALSAAPTTDADARTYALEQIEAAQAETTEVVARAEKAEQELYELHAALAVLRR